MSRREPASHILAAGRPLCGSNSFAALYRTADCQRCNVRMDDVLEVLLDAAEGKPYAQARAQRLVEKLRLERRQEE